MIKESLIAAEEREAKLDKLVDILQVLEKHVDFKALSQAIDQAAPRPSQEKGGRPSFPTEIMVRTIVLQQLYNLSDEQMEFQLLDRLSTSADKRYKLIRKLKVSTASEHDTHHLEDVLDIGNTSRDVYSDKGYVDGEREARLKDQGWRMRIQRKAPKGKPLSNCQQQRNQRIAKSRDRVEHVYACLQKMGGKGLRCIGLERAVLQLNLKAATYNLRRLCSFKIGGVASAFAY